MANLRNLRSSDLDANRHQLSEAQDGDLLVVELPPATTTRWVTRRKAAVVAAVRAGVLTAEEACLRYKLSLEEFSSWQRRVESFGIAGLRTTKTQDYRTPDADRSTPSRRQENGLRTVR